MQNFMEDLMRSQNASEILIVSDASVSALPDEDFSCSFSDMSIGESPSPSPAASPALQFRKSMLQMQNSERSLNYSHHSTRSCPVQSSPGNYDLGAFRKRHRRLKEMMSPVKVYRCSSSKKPSQVTPSSSEKSSPTLYNNRTIVHRDDLRSRLTRLASDSSIINEPNV